jgi:hypothetical protein
MKKLKNKKRTPQMDEKHFCKFEYNDILSSPDKTVYSCTRLSCGSIVVEHEDAGTGA